MQKLNLSSHYKLPLFTILFLLQASACSLKIGHDHEDDKAGTLDWRACPNEAAFECGTLEVPMDYSNPSGEKIDIALIRKKATGSKPKGSLYFNPGGPGASGIDTLKFVSSGNSIPSAVSATYDLVSFDPRGIGQSREVDCSDEGLGDINGYIMDATAIAEIHTRYSQFAANCTAKYGDYLQHLGSLNVVRDMDKIRHANGDEKMNFIGYSYGTRLAALYLQEYPENSGRIVLDAGGHSVPTVRKVVAGQLLPKQANLQSVFAGCIATDPNCDPDALLTQLENRLNAISPPSSQSENMELNLLLSILPVLADVPGIGQMATDAMVDYVSTLNPAVLQNFLEQMQATSGDDDGPQDNDTARIAVLCADDAIRPEVGSLTDDLNEFNQISDIYAEFLIAQLSICAGWPAAVDPMARTVTNTAPISLVIGGTTDAQSPLAYSEEIATQIGGVFITSEHFGHTVVWDDANSCVDDLVENFLLDGMAPATTICEAD